MTTTSGIATSRIATSEIALETTRKLARLGAMSMTAQSAMTFAVTTPRTDRSSTTRGPRIHAADRYLRKPATQLSHRSVVVKGLGYVVRGGLDLIWRVADGDAPACPAQHFDVVPAVTER
jgi:hypothetical protein